MEQKEKSRQSIEFILNCAISEFADKGVNVSLNNICKKNNISKGKLYHHFSSKEDLLCECVCYALDKLSEDISAYEIDDSLTVQENMHNYYCKRIEYWIKFPSHQAILRLAYVLRRKEFSEDSMAKIAQYKKMWDDVTKAKVLQIIHSKNNLLKINDKDFADLVILLYENTFQAMEGKIVRAVLNNESENVRRFSAELLEHYDTIISTVLFGIFK